MESAPEGQIAEPITSTPMRSRAGQLWEYLRAGGQVYVCGGATVSGNSITVNELPESLNMVTYNIAICLVRDLVPRLRHSSRRKCLSELVRAYRF
jgi:hypothetical protein